MPLGFVHSFVPPSEGVSLTLLLLHGTGGNETDLLPLGSQMAPGAALLSPRGNPNGEGESPGHKNVDALSMLQVIEEKTTC